MARNNSAGLSALRRLQDWINTISVAGISSEDTRLPRSASPSLAWAMKAMISPWTTSTPRNFQGRWVQAGSLAVLS
ncbi:hypothetical protein D9M68_865770 [compost metagenome]